MGKVMQLLKRQVCNNAAVAGFMIGVHGFSNYNANRFFWVVVSHTTVHRHTSHYSVWMSDSWEVQDPPRATPMRMRCC